MSALSKLQLPPIGYNPQERILIVLESALIRGEPSLSLQTIATRSGLSLSRVKLEIDELHCFGCVVEDIGKTYLLSHSYRMLVFLESSGLR